jgi:hypothetical protein
MVEFNRWIKQPGNMSASKITPVENSLQSYLLYVLLELPPVDLLVEFEFVSSSERIS